MHRPGLDQGDVDLLPSEGYLVVSWRLLMFRSYPTTYLPFCCWGAHRAQYLTDLLENENVSEDNPKIYPALTCLFNVHQAPAEAGCDKLLLWFHFNLSTFNFSSSAVGWETRWQETETSETLFCDRDWVKISAAISRTIPKTFEIQVNGRLTLLLRSKAPFKPVVQGDKKGKGGCQ